MTLLILLVFLIVAIGVASARRGAPTRPPLMIPPPIDPGADEESPVELSQRDPVEAMLRYGTPEDAARLIGQGVDLSTLGYRPPGEA